jgi:ACS family allantoate permease-like MFS transporter
MRRWLITFYSLVADIPNGGISNFFSVLITSFGYTAQQSLLYGTPGGAIEVVTIVGWAFLTLRYPNGRIFFSALSLALAVLGIILIVALKSNVGRLIGYVRRIA